jgi:cytochrome c1
MMRLITKGALSLGLALGMGLGVGAPAALGASKDVREPREFPRSWDGPLGRFDVAQLQRGFQVYKEVCSSCHAMEFLSYRNLGEPRGPFYQPGVAANDNPVVRAIAAEYTVMSLNDETGEMEERPAEPKDRFFRPFPNEAAARAANGGAYPVEMSLITRARKNGELYVYSLLTGYVEPPAGTEVPPGLHYNPYFPGGLIAMPSVLNEGQVEFQDGTVATVSQMAQDVTAFLSWAADPKQEIRKAMGLQVLAYLLVLTGLVYVSYRRIWRNVH